MDAVPGSGGYAQFDGFDSNGDGMWCLKGVAGFTRDARTPYIQSLIDKPGRPRTWLRLPKALWTASWFYEDGIPQYRDPVVILEKALYGHPESGPTWDKKLHASMKKAGFQHLEGSPGFFYDKARGVECTVYVDDFILISPPALEAKVWKQLESMIDIKDPQEPVTRYLGIYHEFTYSKDGKVTGMRREGSKYLTAVVQRYMEEIGAKSLPRVGSPALDDSFDEKSEAPGKQAGSAASHLM